MAQGYLDLILLLPFLRESLSFFDSAPLWAESGIVSDTRSSGLASPRQRRRSFVSSDFTKSALPLSSGSLAPFVNVVGFNTQPRCGALRHQNHQSATSHVKSNEESSTKDGAKSYHHARDRQINQYLQCQQSVPLLSTRSRLFSQNISIVLLVKLLYSSSYNRVSSRLETCLAFVPFNQAMALGLGIVVLWH